MPKARPQPDVVVLGAHPACWFAAALLQSMGASVTHCAIPGEHVGDRLVHINPRFLELHKLLSGLAKEIELTPVHGLKFLSDDPKTRAEHTAKSPVCYIASLHELRDAMAALAKKHKCDLLACRSLEIHALDENGVELSIDARRIKPRLLLVGGALSPAQKKLLGIFPAPPDADGAHRYTYLRLKGSKLIDASPKLLMPMSLDLRSKLQWGWVMPASKEVQISVEQPAREADREPPHALLAHWIRVLIEHSVLRAEPESVDLSKAESIDLPLAGALVTESVANRTLLIGPAGGFYSACAEDIYPACWSALFAAEVAHKALSERHLQDAIQAYRLRWGTELGDYLRGPHQNLRFLLPLVYRNPVMTARMSEAILAGSSVVR